MAIDKHSVGIVGARGHTGAELIRLIAAHPSLELAFVSSRELGGQRVDAHNDAYAGDLRYENLNPSTVAAKQAGVVILALPNGKAAPYVEAIDAMAPGTLIVDLSAVTFSVRLPVRNVSRYDPSELRAIAARAYP